MHRTAALAMAAALLAAGGARADDCAKVMEAGLKSLRVPSKTTTVTTGFNVMPLTAVVITVGGKKYSIRTNRGWITTHYDQTGAEELYRRSFAGDANICTPDGTETIGGDMTDVFNSNYRNGDGSRVHERIWISEATGLPVREQASIIGGLNLTMTTTMEYNDIRPPEGLPTSPPDTEFPADGPDSSAQTPPRH